MSNNRFKLGMGQMLVEGGKIDDNFRRALEMIDKAVEKGCKIIVLPECLDMGWTYPEAKKLAQPIPDKYSDIFCQKARNSKIYIVAGLTEKSGDRIYNSAVFISPDGDILIKHRKINVLTIAQDIYSIGNSLSVAETDLGTIGINICADNFPQSLVLGYSLARMGAQLILSPSSWVVPPDYDNEKRPYDTMWKESYKTLASRYEITVVGVSNVGWVSGGVWGGRKAIGGSLAVGPKGDVIARGAYGESEEGLIVADIEMIPRTKKGTAIDDD